MCVRVCVCVCVCRRLHRLCNSTKPGEGRVLACLQEERAWIESAACKKQMLRMLGLAVEDYRLDYTLSQVSTWSHTHTSPCITRLHAQDQA